MDASNFANPVEIVQFISIVSYVNTLSDFLYVENYLLEEDQHKQIPIVNALYEYLHDHDHKLEEKEIFIRKLLEGSDLYGEKENETLDVHFVNTMFDHIITSLVFDKYKNIYGFLAEIMSSAENVTVYSLNRRILQALETMTFENEFGNASTLTHFSAGRILVDLILPLFPQPQNDMNIISVDYIYAQAGLMFLRSSRINSAYYSRINIINKNIPHANAINFDIFQKIISITDSLFNEYLGIGYAIEQLVIAEKLGESALSIFALPALLNFAMVEKKNIYTMKFENIIDNPTIWTEAYKLLFFYLNTALKNIESSQDNDHRYQFYLALSNFKNRKELAIQNIQKFCPLLSESDMSEEVQKYQDQTNYACKSGTGNELLPDINKLFEKQNNFIRNKYFLFEKELIRDAFSEDLIKSIDTDQVIIMKGSILRNDCDFMNIHCYASEVLKSSFDLLEFYYSKNQGISLYYALIRENNNITLMKEADNVTLFRQIVGDGFFRRLSNPPYKYFNEKFDDFLTKLADERANEFKAHLDWISFSYPKEDSWKNFGLSLIPFYSCITSSIKGEIREAFFSCPMDIISSIPVIGEVGSIFAKVTSAATRYLLSKVGTTFESMSLRGSIRSVINIKSDAFLEEISNLKTLVSGEIFKNFGIALHRLVDPGFELASAVGKEGISSLLAFFSKMESKFHVALQSLEKMLDRVHLVTSSGSRKIGLDMHVKTIENSGYGYKFLELPHGEVAHSRTILQSNGKTVEVLVVPDTESNEKLYKLVDPLTRTIEKDGPHLYDKEGRFLIEFPERKSYKYSLKSYDDVSCNSRSKRSPTEKVLCIRTSNLQKKLDRENEAMAIGQGKFSKEEILNELRKYVFPNEGKTEKDFVEEWSTNEMKPEWSKDYKIDNHEHFFNLKYKVRLDSVDVIDDEAEKRINSLYTKLEKKMIETASDTKNLAYEYMEAKAYNTIMFEDYYALRNYMAYGYERITGNTDEARRMKNAIYTLAIRQSDDLVEEFATTLYRGEVRPREVISKMFSGKKNFEVKRFFSTTNSEFMATSFASPARPGYRSILYKMNFEKNKRYIRASVSKIHETFEEETILLPGSKFVIEKVSGLEDSEGIINVELSFMHDAPTKHEWQKNIMKEIKKLRNSETVFYYQDIPT